MRKTKFRKRLSKRASRKNFRKGLKTRRSNTNSTMARGGYRL